MLFEIVFQWAADRRTTRACCDLMLFEIVFQFCYTNPKGHEVVI